MRTRPYRMLARAQAAEATAERIREAAHQLFAEQPYDQVSLNQVARRAGVATQTVLRRFESKENLFAAVARWRSAQLRADREQAPEDDADGAVANLIGNYEQWGREILHLLAQEGRSPLIADVVESGRRFHHSWVERVFATRLTEFEHKERRRQLDKLIAVTDIYVWKVLRHDLRLPRRQVEQAMLDLVECNLPCPYPASDVDRGVLKGR